MQQAAFETVLPNEWVVGVMRRFLLRVASERPDRAVTSLADSCGYERFGPSYGNNATGGRGLGHEVRNSRVDASVSTNDSAAVRCGRCGDQPHLGRVRNRDVCLAHLFSAAVVHREVQGKVLLRQLSEIAVGPGRP